MKMDPTEPLKLWLNLYCELCDPLPAPLPVTGKYKS